jgi:2,4-dienoyl-CoA reductase-like NADH-dependent reductase (Old Yellow Enzyme family)
MVSLYDSLIINKMELKNRFVRSATLDTLGDNGMVTDSVIKLYCELAKGQVGLIITGGLFPSEEGRLHSGGQIGVHTDKMIPGLKKLVRIVHENGGRIGAQLVHKGWGTMKPVGPSSMVNPKTGLKVRELSENEIDNLVELFVQAAKRVIEADFDAIQLHGAHSHLISTFLSPVTNKREDKWGGSPEKRSNFIREIYKGIRNLVGSDYPILIKLGLVDYHPNGKQLSEGIYTATSLEADGVDAIEVSEGLEEERRHHIRLDAMHPYYLHECLQARKALTLPLILVGGIRYLQDMEAILQEGVAAAISMCRPFIRDPHIVVKFHNNSIFKSECVSCNSCAGQQLNVRHCILE